MTKEQLVREYADGHIDRRHFVRGLTTLGVSAVAAVGYADTIRPAVAAQTRRNVGGMVAATCVYGAPNPGTAFSTTSGIVGDTVSVTVCGATLGSTVSLLWDGSPIATGGVSSLTLGSATVQFTVPNATKGSHIVTVQLDSTPITTQTFTVDTDVSLDTLSGTAGTTVTATITGGLAGGTVTARFDGNLIVGASTTVNGTTGDATLPFTIPTATAGTHTISIEVNGAQVASFTFTIVTGASLSPSSGTVGSTVTISVTGATVGGNVTATFNGSPVTLSGTTTVNGSGAATVTFSVPNAPSGVRSVAVLVNSVIIQTLTFTVQTDATLSPLVGAVGSTVTATITGGPAGAQVNVDFDGTALIASAIVNSTTGVGTVTFTVPASSSGPKPVDVKLNGTTFESFTFTVVADATISPTSGFVADDFTVSVTGAASGGILQAQFAGALLSGSATVNASGSASKSFKVPLVTKGPKPVDALINGNIVETLSFNVLTNATLSPAQGSVGSTVTVSVNGGVASGTLRVRFNGTLLSPTSILDASGVGSLTFTVPNATNGVATVVVEVNGIAEKTLFFGVSTAATLSPSSGFVGSKITISVIGGVQNQTAIAQWDGVTLTSKKVDSRGRATLTFNVPPSAQGAHTVRLAIGSSYVETWTYTVLTKATVSPASGTVASTATVTITGGAYQGGQGGSVSILYDSTPLSGAGGVVNSTGGATVPFTIPESSQGAHQVTARITLDGTTDVVAWFSVTPRLTLNPTSGSVGTSLIMTLIGGGSNSTYFFRFGNQSPITATTNSVGTASVNYTIPSNVKKGNINVTVRDVLGNLVAQATFKLN